jgi:hypothetical protein
MKDVVAEVQIGLKELAAEDRDGWSSLARSDRFRDIEGLHEGLEVERIRTVAEWDRHTDWADDGAVTAVSWVKHQLQLPVAEAAVLVRLARHYAEHRSVREALDGGEISVAKVRAMVKAERRHEEMFATCVDGLVDLAREHSLEEFTAVMAEWVELVDDRDPPDESKRSWKSSTSSGLGRGVLDSSEDELNIIEAAIESLDTLDPEDGPEPPRSREQRHHDIVIDIFRRVLSDELGDDPAATGNVDVVVDADVAAEVTAEEQPTKDPQQALDEAAQQRRQHHPDGRRATRAFVAALLCSGFIRRIIIDPVTGQAIDVGRSQRRFTAKQWRALVIRDGGCVFPGCDRGPKWCDAHHLKPWEAHGPTDLDNGCLLCRRHHVLVHKRGWKLERDPRTGIVTATAPDGRQFTRRPHQPR